MKWTSMSNHSVLKKIFEEKYGDIKYTMTPYEVMEAAICDPERFAPAPQLLEEIE